MLVSLITAMKYHTIQLPEWKEGRFVLTDPEGVEELFEITGDGKKWTIQPLGYSSIAAGDEVVLEHNQMLSVHIGRATAQAYVFTENVGSPDAPGPHYAKYARNAVDDSVIFEIGTDLSMDIPLISPHIAGHHCTLISRNRVWSVAPRNAAAKVYVNGVRTQGATLKPGDMVSVLNQRFIVLPGVLVMNGQNLNLNAVSYKLRKRIAPPVPEDKIVGRQPATEFFSREPRFTDGLFARDVNVVAPPPQLGQSVPGPYREQTGTSDGLMTYGPALASGLMTLAGGMASPLMGLGMLFSQVVIPFFRRNKQKEAEEQRRLEYEKQREQQIEEMRREEERRQREYSDYLRKLDRELDELNLKQTQKLLSFNPRADQEARNILQDKTSLWNRRPGHSDYLDIRLGTGNLPVRANINFPDEASLASGDPLRQTLKTMREKERVLRGVPIMLQLERFYSVGVAGLPQYTDPMVAQMMLQLSQHIGYDNLKICILGKLPQRLESLRWLPHTWDDEGSVHLIARDKDELTQLLPALDKELRQHRPQNRQEDAAQSQRTMVFLICDGALASSGMVKRLLFDQPYERVHVIATALDSQRLPQRTDMSISVRAGEGRMLWQEPEGRQTADFVPDVPVTELLEPMAELMANTKLDLLQETNRMPDVVPFLEQFKVSDLGRLSVMNRWRRSDPVHSLAAPIGVSEDGNLCMLDLHERGDGPHGLVAGTTGSGKSELLINYILSMAVNYAPHEVSFVLIDYKGGGMAHAFENLPHTAGVITNLDGNEIKRSLLSIQSELERRQQLFVEYQERTGARNIDIYKYQKLFREGKVLEPLSHLIIITDEFAELKTQQPEFLDQLVRAARIGRSLGVHLILATQKPGTIVDEQIWSNANFHICLRVQSPRDSVEVIKCEDAARLTKVGSMFKQVGYGEVLVKAQSGWAGADYVPDAVNLPGAGVDVVNHMGSVLHHEDLAVESAGDMSQLEATIAHLIDRGKQTGLRARRLWEPVLEEEIPLDKLRQKYGVQDQARILQPVLGEVDDPARQKRSLLRLDLTGGRNTVIVGGEGSGKVMALTTVMEDLLLHHTAQEMQMYILDCADDGLSVYRDAPQVGDVIGSDEGEKLRRLLTMLEEEIRSRRKKLGSAVMGETLTDRLEKAELCQLLVIIHHAVTFQKLAGEQVTRFYEVMKDGPRCGISFLATQESAGGMSFQMSQHLPIKYVLQMNSDDEYSMILNRTGGFRPAAIKGRGMFRDENLYEFQTATAGQDPREMCLSLQKSWRGVCAKPVRTLPEQLAPADLISDLKRGHPWQLPAAMSVQTLQTEYVDLTGQYIYLALGRRNDLRLTMQGLAEVAAKNSVRVVLMDPAGENPGVGGVQYVGAGELDAVITSMRERYQGIRKLLDAGRPLPFIAPTLYLIPSLEAVLSTASDEPEGAAVWLQRLMISIRDVWNCRFIVGGSVKELEKYKNTEWFGKFVSVDSGIFLGRGLTDQFLMKYENASKAIGDAPQGYLLKEREACRVLFVQREEEGGD